MASLFYICFLWFVYWLVFFAIGKVYTLLGNMIDDDLLSMKRPLLIWGDVALTIANGLSWPIRAFWRFLT